MIALILCLLTTAEARPPRADITALAVSPDGARVATAIAWTDTSERALLTVADVATGAITLQHQPSARVLALAFGADGAELAYAVAKEAASVVRLSVPSGRALPPGPTFSGSARELSYSSDGKWLAVAGSRAFFVPEVGKPNAPPTATLVVWNLALARAEHSLVLAPLRSVRFAADSQSMLVGTTSDAFEVIDVGSAKVERSAGTLTDPRLSAYFPSGVLGGFDAEGLFVVREGQPARVPAQIDSRISVVQVAADGRLVWVGANDGVVRAFDPDTGAELYSIAPWLSRAAVPVPVAIGGARSLSFSADGGRLAVANGTAAIEVWDTRGGRLVRRMTQTGMSMASVTYLADGSGVIAGTASGYAIELDPSTGEARGVRGERSGLAVNAVAVSADGLRMAYGSSDGRVRLETSQPGTWAPSRRLLDHKGKAVRELVFVASGAVLASRDDEALRLWDTRTGEPIAPPDLGGPPRCLCGGGNSIGVCTDTALLLIDSADRRARTLGTHRSGFTACAIDNAASRIALVARGGAQVWPLSSAGGSVHDLGPDFAGARQVAFAPSGDRVAVALESDIALYDASGRELRRLQGRARPQAAVSFQPKGGLLAAGGRDGRVRIWDLVRARMIKSLDVAANYTFRGQNVGSPVMLSLSPNGYHLGIGYESGAVMLWDLSAERPIALAEAVGPVHAVRFNAAGTKFMVSAANAVFVYDPTTGGVLSKRGLALGDADKVVADFYQDGEMVALGAAAPFPHNPDFSVMFADSAKRPGGTVRQLPGMAPNRLINVSPDGSTWSVASWADTQPKAPATLWELAELLDRDSLDPAERGALLDREGKRINIHKMNDRAFTQIRLLADRINALALRPDNAVIAAGFGAPDGAGEDYSLRLLDRDSGAGPRLPHDGAVLDVEWREDGRMLAAASLDGKVRLWKPNGQPIADLVAVGADDWAITLPDGHYTASLNAARGMSFRVGNRALPFDQFDLLLHRPDLVVEALAQGWSLTNEAQLEALKRQRAGRLAKVGYRDDQLGQNFDLPQVRIARRSALPTQVKQRRLTFDVNAYSSHAPLASLQVTVNEVPAFGRKGLSLPRAQRAQNTVSLELSAGRNIIQVSAFDAAGNESLRDSFEVELDVVSKPTLFIVAVGVSKYAQRGYDLSYPVSDAKALAAFFTQTPGRFARVETKVLTDTQASRQGLLSARKLLSRAGPDDMVVVLLAGHGLRTPRDEFFFATYDVDFKRPQANGLSAAEIEAFFDDSKARRRLLLMDACYSGESDTAVVAVNEQPTASAKGIKLRGVQLSKSRARGALGAGTMESLFADLRRGSGAVVIAAAAGIEQAAERSDLEHGIFTYALLDGITNAAADRDHDGQVQVSELREHVVALVRQLSGGAQTPTVNRDNLALDFPVAWRGR